MKRILSGCSKLIILSIVFVISIISILLMLQVEINYDLSKYLPNDSKTNQALKILEEEFNNFSMVEVMVSDVSINEALLIKERLKEIDEVSQVIWLDDLEDINMPINNMELNNVLSYYQDSKALYTVIFSSGDYDLETENGINKIRNLNISNDIYIRGVAISNIETRNLTNSEIMMIILIVVPFAILILFLASNSWYEPLLILITMGVAIIINMGSNIMFESVSFITFSMAAVLQLAISLDYSLFLIHRFYEEYQNGNSIVNSVIISLKKSIGSITASAFTTIAGFLALLVMRYEIGRDIGLVMAKGVLLSYLSAIIVLPILIVIFAPLLKRGMHKSFLPKFKRVGKILKPLRYVILVLVISLAGLGIYFSNQTNYYYGANSSANTDSLVSKEKDIITNTFNAFEPVLVIVPKGHPILEYNLINELRNHENVIGVEGLYAFVDPEIPKEMIPIEIINQFEGTNYAQIIINTNLSVENEHMYQFSNDLELIVKDYYEEFYIAGEAPSINDIKNTAISDQTWVMIISISAVLLILLIVFKFNLTPIILVLLIQVSIWVNFSIPYLENMSLAFIGYLVVSSLQLGATIDYAVLLASRYQEERQKNNSFISMNNAIIESSPSILTSSLILTTAGYLIGMISTVDAVKEMGTLIGRGALLSGILVLFILGPLLMVFDKITNRKIIKRSHKNEKI